MNTKYEIEKYQLSINGSKIKFLNTYSNYLFQFFILKKCLHDYLLFSNAVTKCNNFELRVIYVFLCILIFYLLNKLFINFLINLEGKILHFNKFKNQNIEF